MLLAFLPAAQDRLGRLQATPNDRPAMKTTTQLLLSVIFLVPLLAGCIGMEVTTSEPRPKPTPGLPSTATAADPLAEATAISEQASVAPEFTPTRLTTATATYPPPPQPTGEVDLVLPDPLPTPGGPVTAYPSLNSINDLAFARDGALWAATYEGLVRWDLVTDDYQHLSQADGLPAPGVLSLAVDADGTVWAGTQAGVARYDSQTWTNYPLAGLSGDGGPAPMVYDVAVAPDGSVWAGTDQGASRFEGQMWQHYTAGDGLADTLVWQVAPAPDGSVWFSTHGGGVSHFQPYSDQWITYSAPDSFPLPNARDLAIGPEGLPWVHIGYDNVYRFDGQTWVVAYPSGGGQWVCDLAFSADGTPWIATCGGWHAYGGGLLHRVGDQWQPITTEDGLISNDLTALALRPDGVMAAGSRQGISVWQDGRWRTLRGGPTLAPVTAAIVTQDGDAWFAFGDDQWQAAGGGLARYDGQGWHYITRANGLPGSDNVRALDIGPDGSLWVGGGCGVARLRDGDWQVLATCDDVQGNVRGLDVADDGSAWFITEFDLYRVDDHGLAHYPQQSPLALAIAADGAAWLSHQPWDERWVSSFDGQSWRPYTDTLGVGVVTSLAATADGSVWAGSGSGVARLAGPERPRLYTGADGLPEGGVADLTVAPDGALWAATASDAVARLDGDSWTVYDLGISQSQIQAIAPGVNQVWLATARGVIALSP